MSSSTQYPSEINVQNIRFYNGTLLGNTNSFTNEVRCKKRLRVDNDLDVNGKISYVDNQTGWGLPQWTYKATSGYNVTTDSLIAKIKIIEDSYATKTYVDSGGQFSTAQGISYYASDTFYMFNDPTSKYQYPITTLAADSGLIIRDINDTEMIFKFQKGTPGVGKVLGCIDTDGTVAWVGPNDGTTTQVTSVSTSNGTSNSYSFRVVDTGLPTTESLVFYPDMANNNFNKGILTRDHVILGGTFENKSAINRVFLGPYSEGSEGVAIENTRTLNGILTPGKTIITGGYYTIDEDQRITLSSDGIKLKPAPNLPFVIEIPHQAKNLSATPAMFRKSLLVTTNFNNTDEYPLLLMVKNGTTGGNIENEGIGMFSKLNNTFYNPLVKTYANAIISADWGTFLTNGNKSTIPEKPIQLFLGPFSSYADGFTVSPNITSEINDPSDGGYTQMTSYDTQNYIQVNKNGIVQLTGGARSIMNYGNFYIQNKTGSIFNNTNNDQISSLLQVGTIDSLVPSSFYGDFTVRLGNIYLQPTGIATVSGYFLKCISSDGKAEWGQLPSSYSSLDITSIKATKLEANTISLTYVNSTSAAISIQKSSIFQGINDKFLHFDNNEIDGQIVFAVKDSNNQQQIPISFNSGGVKIYENKAIVYSDNTQQTSAYTGAKGLNGAYTYCNLTIDSDGKITAISSNPSTSIPSTVDTPITFQGGVTFKNSSTLFDSDTTFNKPIEAKSTLEVAGVLTCMNFNSQNIIRSVDMGYGISCLNYQNVQQMTSLDSTTFGIYNNDISDYEPNNIYFVTHPDYLSAGVIDIPADSSRRVQFNIPLRLTHNWAFQGEQEPIQFVAKTFFYYYVEQIQILLSDTSSNANDYSFTYTNTSLHSSVDLGFFYIAYDRTAGTAGPDDDKHVMTQEFLISNPHIQFVPNKNSVSKSYYVKVKYVWSYRYEREGGQVNNARNHWGNPDASHYFEPWHVTLNPSSSVKFENYALNYNNNTPNLTDKYQDLWKNPLWKKPFYPDSNNFNWGTYYGTLPWGQISSLNNDQIFTNTKVLCGVGHFGTLLVNGDVQSTGLIQCRGYMGRPGLGSNSNNGNLSYGDMFQLQALSSNNWFNNFWTGERVETWVDYSKLLSQSPNVSDYRIKSNFKKIANVLDSICKTSIYQFDIDYNLYHVTCKTGVVAHELQENLLSFPRLVNGNKDAIDQEGKIIPQSIDYQELTIILMKAVQELKVENDELKEQINQLNAKMSQLYSMVESLLSPQTN